MGRERFEVPPEKLRRQCDPLAFHFSSTEELPDFHEIIGQLRATRALEFGIDIPSYGFNVYVLGPTGVGKTTTVNQFLAEKAQKEPVPEDWCYVHNWAESRKPKALCLPAGRGVRVAKRDG